MKALMRSLLIALAFLVSVAYGQDFQSKYSLTYKPPSFTFKKDLELVITYELVKNDSAPRIMPAFRDAEKIILELGPNSPCKSIAVNVFGNASHPGGNEGGKLNERTGGYGMTCYTDAGKDNSYFVYGMDNSQRKPTLAFGLRKGITIYEWNGFRFDAGIAGTLTAYEKADRSIVYAAFPFRYTKLSYEFTLPWGGSGYLGVNQDYFRVKNGNIRLRNMEMKFQKQFW